MGTTNYALQRLRWPTYRGVLIGLMAVSITAFGAVWAQDQRSSPSLDDSGNELSYGHFVGSNSRFKCLYGYAADKTGDHQAALQIFHDCAERFGDVYSMIWLSQMHESGSGVPQSDSLSTAWVRQGALAPDTTGYASLARYHYGVALHQGRGVPEDAQAARYWLELAASQGVRDATDYLRQHHFLQSHP